MTGALRVGVAGAKSGGVSTIAHALAAAAVPSGPSMLVEADPSGGSLLTWSDVVQPAGDLYDVVMSRDSDGLASVAQQLGGLAVVPAWGDSFRLTQALSRSRMPWEMVFGGVDGTVVVDVGRVSAASPTMTVLAAMDVVVLVSASEPGPVATTLEWVGRAGRHGADDIGLQSERLRMVTSEVVGRRRRSSVDGHDVDAVTGPGFLGHFPHDDTAVDLLRRGVDVTDRALRSRRFIEVARWVADTLTDPARVGVIG